MKGFNFRVLMVYAFFVIATVLSCTGNLALAKVLAPITVYLSKKTLVHQKEDFHKTALVRTITPDEQPSIHNVLLPVSAEEESGVKVAVDEESSMVKHADLITHTQKSIRMEWI
jgi:hypothetical protein